MNDNTELLTWAVENITEWEDDYTHLRSDNLEHPFFCTGVWLGVRDIYWKSSDIGENLYAKVFSKKFSTKTLQVITKQEYIDAVNASKTSSEPLQGHIHANLIAEYAIVAKTSPEPWREYQGKPDHCDEWASLISHPTWSTKWHYRRKPSPPKTMKIGDVVVEACPLKEAPSKGADYHQVSLDDDGFEVQSTTWDDYCFERQRLRSGVVFATQQEAQAVADALNSIYKKAVDEVWNSL